MREHPIPQDITNYRFHIIGSMTLKQFGVLFLGVIGAIIVYSTNLPQVVKWVFILVSVGLGAVGAFVPIQERPLDHWIVTFFKVLYNPTKYFWKRTPKVPEPFMYEPRSNQEPIEPELDLTPAKRARIKEYLTSVNTPSEYQTDLTDWEAGRVQQITQIFSTAPVVSSNTSGQKPKQKKQGAKPNITVRVRNLRGNSYSVDKNSGEVTVYGQPGSVQAPQMPEVELSKIESTSNNTQATTQHQSENNNSQQPSNPVQYPEQQREVSIPKNQPAVIKDENSTSEDQNNSQNQTSQESSGAQSQFSYVKHQRNQGQQKTTDKAQDAAYNRDLPFPDPPDDPNKIVGMILTPSDELITNAIVEIQTEDGQIVRAVKTNALGQFFITTPLNNGKYVVEVEKNGYSFNPQKITLKGEPVEPLEIRSI